MPCRGIVHESRSHSRGAAAFMLAITAASRDSASRGLTGLLGATPRLSEQIDSDGALVVGPFGLPISTQKR